MKSRSELTLTKRERARCAGVLAKAHALLARPGGWMKGEFARNAAGERIGSRSPAAVSFCIVGAIQKATTSALLVRTVLGLLVFDSEVQLSQWNDAQTTRAPVLRLLTRVIRGLEAAS